MKKRIAAIFVLSGFAAIVLLIFGYLQIEEWGRRKISVSTPVAFSFQSGTRLAELGNQLTDNNLVDSPLLFRSWVRLFSDYSKFKAGEYEFAGEVAPQDIASKFIAGEVREKYALEFTIPEGFNVKQVVERLAAKGVASEEELSRLAQDRDFLTSLKIPSSTIEGYFYPLTYRFSKMPSAQDVFREAVSNFWKNLPKDYETNVGYLGLTLDQAVAFASLIEMETPFDDEKPMISEVIWRRLKSNMPIAIDAAVIYGIKDYRGNITRRHLEDRENKYNNRIYQGLPPTPICSPAMISLQAVLTPAKEGYLYYVLDQSTGRHHFSKTADEHNSWVQKLVQAAKTARANGNGTSGKTR